MKVLLDHCVPRPLRRRLPGHAVKAASDMGWALVKNGDLIRIAEAEFEVLITCDKNLRFQQNLKHRKLAIVELPTNHMQTVLELAPRIRAALDRVKPGGYIELKFPN